MRHIYIFIYYIYSYYDAYAQGHADQIGTLDPNCKTVAHAILSPYAVYMYLVQVQLSVHIPGDPESVQLRNATTSTRAIDIFLVAIISEQFGLI